MSGRFLRIRIAAAIVLTLFSLRGITPADASGIKLYLVPAMGSNTNAPTQFMNACLSMNQWPNVLHYTSYLGVAQQFLANRSDADLATCYQNMRNNHLQLLLEQGVVKPQCAGAGCFADARNAVDRAKALGAPFGGGVMDDPLAGGTGSPNFFSMNDTVNYTADWIALMRQTYGNIQIIDFEAFPSASVAQLSSWISALHDACIARGVAPPNTFQLDFDWSDNRWSWADLFSLRDAAHAVGEDFGMNFWGASASGSSNDADWWTSLSSFTQAERRLGPTPELFTIESFINVPQHTVPENLTYSFMWSVNQLILNNWYPGPPVTGGPNATRLNAGALLNPGDAAASPSGEFVLTYQTDGNLVLYDNGSAVWAINCWPACNSTGFAGNPFVPPGYATMQSDGNFVVYNASGGPVFHTSTFNNPGAYLAIQDDGNLVVYSSGGAVLWQR